MVRLRGNSRERPLKDRQSSDRRVENTKLSFRTAKDNQPQRYPENCQELAPIKQTIWLKVNIGYFPTARKISPQQPNANNPSISSTSTPKSKKSECNPTLNNRKVQKATKGASQILKFKSKVSMGIWVQPTTQRYDLEKPVECEELEPTLPESFARSCSKQYRHGKILIEYRWLNYKKWVIWQGRKGTACARYTRSRSRK